MNLNCLQELGILTAAQVAKLGPTMNQLPSGTSELLKLLNAQLLSKENDGTIIGVQTLTKDNVTVGVLTIPDGATKAIITVYDNGITYRLDAGVPAGPSTGHYVSALATIELDELEGFRFVAYDNSASAKIYVTYFN